jgi:Holliday junction resolvase-like predicted endonuclease
MYITKASGKSESFNPQKLIRSLKRSGASQKKAVEIFELVKKEIKGGMGTEKIYSSAFKHLKKTESLVAARYSLKKAIRDLGPTGYPFEHFIAALLKKSGYSGTQVGKRVQGKCVMHEVDVIAKKDDRTSMLEAKFRNNPGDDIDVKVILYIHSRFNDIMAHWVSMEKKSKSNLRTSLITNVKYSKDAVAFAECVGLNIIGWRYPKNKGLEYMIESMGLHPITVLTGLGKKEIDELLKRGVVLCRDVVDTPSELQRVGVNGQKVLGIREQARHLCELKK